MTIRKKSNKLRLINFVKVLGLDENKEILIVDGVVTSKEQAGKINDFVVIDSVDCIISPGFVDPQVNGFENCNFWAVPPPSFNQIDDLRLKLALHGIVAFCPTIITASTEKTLQSIDYINSYIKQASNDAGARILGIHVEGIFITKYGVHNDKYAQKDLSVKKIEPFVKDNVILFTLAPELDQTGDAIRFLQKSNILVSVGHSNATYQEGIIAIEKYGLKTVTHMFNCLRGVEGFSHRRIDNGSSNLEILKLKLDNDKNIVPHRDGIMLALLKNKNVLCMVISDGVHVSKDVIKFLRDYKDKAHFALTSDMVASDFFDASKSEGFLGGGQIIMDQCVLNLVNWKVSNLEDSLTCASKPIANQLRVAKQLGLGEICLGKEANIVLWNTKKNAVKGTIIGENVFLNY